jgi:hypothetical protein
LRAGVKRIGKITSRGWHNSSITNQAFQKRSAVIPITCGLQART